MTVAQVQALGRLTWDELRPPDGRQACMPYGNAAKGNFRAADGTAMELTFEAVTQKGEPLIRYRLTGISLELPDLTETQTLTLLHTLTRRYGPMEQERAGASGTTTSKDGQFTILIVKLDKGMQGKESPASLFLAAHYRFMEKWVMSLPKCQLGVPRV